jgi:hypothetical protein
MINFIPQLPLASANGQEISYHARALALNNEEKEGGLFHDLQVECLTRKKPWHPPSSDAWGFYFPTSYD